jgi:hypothetical protein
MNSQAGQSKRRHSLALALTFSVLGCAQPTPPSPEPTFDVTNRVVMLPTAFNPPDGSLLAQTVGKVRGDPLTGCVWMVGEDGREFSVLWPRGYSATTVPLVILDPRGRKVGGPEDDLVLMGGASPLVEALRATLPDACEVGDSVWVATAVERLGS